MPMTDGGPATTAAGRSNGRSCVLIPVYNAGKTISQVVRAAKQHGVDVLVIDDGSSDDTVPAAVTAGARVVSLLSNQGKGAALRIGFSYALRERYEAVITMDGDGQHDPAEIPKLMEVAREQQAAIVLGNRMTNVTSMPMVRMWTNGFMSTIVSGLTRQQIPDSQCGFRLIRAHVLAGMPLRAMRYEIETELLFRASTQRHKIVSVPIRTIYTAHDSHIRPVRDAIRFLSLVVRHLVSSRPNEL